MAKKHIDLNKKKKKKEKSAHEDFYYDDHIKCEKKFDEIFFSSCPRDNNL
jgi:hypothetical protein